MNVFLACFLAILVSQIFSIAWRSAHNWWLFRNVVKGGRLSPNDLVAVQPMEMCTCTECGVKHAEWPKRCECKNCGSKHIHGQGMPMLG